jgi:hypothetical protein
MRKLTRWALRATLVAAATGSIVAACYDVVPRPSAPLPPTREVKPVGPRPKPLPSPAPLRKKPATVVEYQSEFQPANPTHDIRDAGIGDAVNLPPVADASGLDAPIIKKQMN